MRDKNYLAMNRSRIRPSQTQSVSGAHEIDMTVLFLHVCSALSLLGGVFAGEQVKNPACCDNDTYGFHKCNEKFSSPNFSLWHNHPSNYAPILCSEHFLLTHDSFDIEANGCLVLSSKDMCSIGPWRYDLPNYCLDYDVKIKNTIAYVCFSSAKTHLPEVPLVQKLCSLVSAVLLFITVAIYVSNKSLKRWSDGAYLISQSVALAGAFVCLARLQFFPKGDCSQCLVAGYCLQYFFLAAFFWMNAHSVNIYLIISKFQPEFGTPSLDEMRKEKFIRASMYAWGVPFVISLTTFVLQKYDLIPDRRFRPDMGHYTCFLFDWKVRWIYFYAPMAVLLVVNIVVFTLTFTRLVKHKRSVRELKTTQSRLERNLWYYKQYFKLIVVTGLSWAGEVMGQTFKKQGEFDCRKDYFWLGLDVFNCLQGVFVFTIFVCPKKIRSKVKWLPWPSLGTCCCSSQQGASFEETGLSNADFRSVKMNGTLNGSRTLKLNSSERAAVGFNRSREEVRLLAFNKTKGTDI